MIVSPHRLGADIVVHSMTKYINGTSDCVAGCICASHDFIAALNDINAGASMLLGPVLDSFRAASILKKTFTAFTSGCRNTALMLCTLRKSLKNSG